MSITISRLPVAFKIPLTTSNPQSSRACVLQQLLVPTSGFYTARHLYTHIHSSFFFHTFPITDKEADVRSCIQSINTLPYSRKVQNSAAAETVYCACHQIHSRTVNCFLCCRVLTPGCPVIRLFAITVASQANAT